MFEGVVHGLLRHHQQIPGDKFRNRRQGAVGLDGYFFSPPLGHLVRQNLERFGECAFVQREHPQRPNRSPQIFLRVLHHPARRFEMVRFAFARRHRFGFTGLQLIAQAAHGLEQGVMQIHRQTIAFPQCGLELDGRIPARVHLGGEQLGLARQLPVQLPRPDDHPQEQKYANRQRTRQPLRRPPRRSLQYHHIVLAAQQ